jgi:tetratricopeptide (TPR) repeat protein
VSVAETLRTVPVFAVGRSAVAVLAAGDPFIGGEARAGVHHLAFGVPDPERAAGEAQAKGIRRLPGDPGHGLQRRRRVALDPAATAGVRIFLTEPAERRPSPPGKVQRIDHIGIASADNRAAIDMFCGRLGLELESQQTDMEVEIAVESFTSDKYGVVYHTRPPRPVGGLSVAFVTAGDCELELLQNLDPAQGGFVDHGGAGTTRQDQGAIARYIASRGVGLHHLAFKVSDIDATLAYRAKGDNDRAIADYSEAIRLSPSYAVAYNNRGLVYHDMRHYERAIADYNDAIRLNPSYALAYYNRGNAYQAKGNYEHAIADYNDAIRLNPSDAFAYNNRGFAHHAKGDYDRAIADYTESIGLRSPELHFPYTNRGKAHQAKGDYERAIVDYNEAIRFNPRYALAHYNRGLAFEALGRREETIADFRRAQSIDPSPHFSQQCSV